jgi:MoaA/NifB/PqqE/SkfB family radical SAM enzyme
MQEQENQTAAATPPFRLDVTLHELLMKPRGRSAVRPPPGGVPQQLPKPVFPQHPELLAAPDEDYFPKEGQRRWKAEHIYRTMKGWMFPYFKSRLLPGEFHPIIAYLFNEWKCNLDCHYCWAFDNSVKGMTEDIAKRSIDWLHDTGCRVLALMGGEPLLRPDFAHKIVYYAAKKDFWVYLPTNGRLLRPAVIDRLADAGLGTVNLAVDAWDIKPGLPKAIVPIRSYFDYLVRKQYKYGFSVFLNINICRNNLDDVEQLTELARDHGIATDYHVCESPMTEQPHFKHLEGNETFIREQDMPMVCELIDRLVARQRAGYKMVNSVERLLQMKDFIHGELNDWNCRAGHNSLIVRVDGTLAPCFPMYSASYDWGTIGDHKFETRQLREMKKSCQRDCFSTLNHILAFCYNDGRVLRWLLEQAKHGFQGVTGNMQAKTQGVA